MRIDGLTGASVPSANVGIYSFGTKWKLNPKSQWEIDCHLFRDPSGQKQFAGKSGRVPEVRDWVALDPKVGAVLQVARMVCEDLLLSHGGQTPISKWVTFGFKDIHGQWISPAVAELVAEELSSHGFVVQTTHYTLEGIKK